MTQKHAYTFRFSPTNEQKQTLARTFGCCVRFLYNWALRKKTDAFSKDHQRLSYKDLSAMLPDVKQQEASSCLSEAALAPLQQSLRHLDRAFLNFFDGRAKYPTFKKKRAHQSATYVGTAFTWRDGCITLARDERAT